MCRAHYLVGDGLSLGMDIGFGDPKILRSPSSISEPWIAPQKSRSFENDVLPREAKSFHFSIIHHRFNNPSYFHEVSIIRLLSIITCIVFKL